MKSQRLFIILPAVMLLLGILACLDSGSRVRRVNELPVLQCAQPPLDPAGPTPDPSIPTPTPQVFYSDFPLGTTIRLGGLGGIGSGVYVTMDNLEVSGPYDVEGGDTQHVACWDVTITNNSLTLDYEYFPQFQLYVIEVEDPSGTGSITRGWTISRDASLAAGEDPVPDIVESGISCDDNPHCIPSGGNSTTIRPCTYIPSPDPVRFGYILDPLDTENVEEMVERRSLGSNVAVWVNDETSLCEYGYEDPSGIQPGPTIDVPAGGLLARWPVDEPHTVSRGYGCTEFFTGELATSCPGSTPWFHNGTDFPKNTGSPYYDVFPIPAFIQHAGDNPEGADCSSMEGSLPPHEGYGNFVRHATTIDGQSITVWGAHLSSFNTSAGSNSAPGQVLGDIGSTGCSSGTHLHFSVRVNGLYVDPVSVLP